MATTDPDQADATPAVDPAPVLRVTGAPDGPVTPPAAVLIDKPPGMSSFGVVKRVRWATGEKRVGHAGTLDPMATGLLIVLVGRGATREQDRFMGMPKVYTGTVRLGETTPSADAETPVDAVVDARHVSSNDVAVAAQAFVGEIEQVPPIYAAVKVGGERLYKKARRGETAETVEIAARRVLVTEFATGAVRPAPGGAVDVDFRVGCSKGTYVRSLARDLARALGVGGHLVALRREAIGPFLAREAWDLDAFVAAHRSEART